MKIILFSRPSEKSSADHFGALLESIEEHNFEWVVNSSTAEWLASKGVTEVAEEHLSNADLPIVSTDSGIAMIMISMQR
jgi:hypothetical protein